MTAPVVPRSAAVTEGAWVERGSRVGMAMNAAIVAEGAAVRPLPVRVLR